MRQHLARTPYPLASQGEKQGLGAERADLLAAPELARPAVEHEIAELDSQWRHRTG
jgi:hypothetical protein